MSTTDIKINKAEQKALDFIKAKIADNEQLPWTKPWKVTGAGLPYNYTTKSVFSGLNLLMASFFSTPEFATFKAISDLGGKVLKGQKGVPMLRPVEVYYLDGKKLKYKEYKALSNDKKAACIKRVFFTNYFVFNIESQTEGIEIKREKADVFTPQLKDECETLISNYAKDCKMHIEVSGKACYRPVSDEIILPKPEQFEKTEMYYSTAFHEMIHSTGHQSRLDRPNVTTFGIFKSRSEYAEEELVAEIGASILNAHYGTFDSTKYTNAAYLKGWLKALKNDPEMIIKASKDSKKAVDYILKYA